MVFLQYGYWIESIKSKKEGKPMMAKLLNYLEEGGEIRAIQNATMNYLRML